MYSLIFAELLFELGITFIREVILDYDEIDSVIIMLPHSHSENWGERRN